jgi:hypothetical protein
VEATCNKVDARVDLCRLGDNGLNARVRTAHHKNDTVRRIDCQR